MSGRLPTKSVDPGCAGFSVTSASFSLGLLAASMAAVIFVPSSSAVEPAGERRAPGSRAPRRECWLGKRTDRRFTCRSDGRGFGPPMRLETEGCRAGEGGHCRGGIRAARHGHARTVARGLGTRVLGRLLGGPTHARMGKGEGGAGTART